MNRPRLNFAAVAFTAAFILCSFGNAPIGGSVYAQQPQTAIVNPDRERGVELFQKGSVKEAIKALREATKKSKDDAEAWHFLGLALARNNDLKGARKAFETSLKSRPNFAPTYYNLAYIALVTNKTSEAIKQSRRALELDANMAEAHYVLGTALLREQQPKEALTEANATTKLNPTFGLAFLLKSQTLINLYARLAADWSSFVRTNKTAPPASGTQDAKSSSALLKDAADSLEQYLKLTPAEALSEVWREQLETLRVYGGSGKSIEDSTKQSAYIARDVAVKARILSKPEPRYTPEARQGNIAGTVVLRAVFASDSKVKHILIISALPNGLTGEAVRAARAIKFIPAMKDGHPVSQFVQIEYNFNLY